MNMFKRILLGIAVFLGLFLLVGFVNSAVKAVVNSVTPSTNDINRTNGWTHVDVAPGIGEAVFNFIQPRFFLVCFEYRTDGDISQMTSPTNYNTGITDGLYPYFCLDNRGKTSTMTRVETISANSYVEVRMVFGGERDERFDWTRFDVTPAPVDACPLMDGEKDDEIQVEVPAGYHKDEESRDCVKDPYDACPNLEGVQSSIPDGYHVDQAGGTCNQFQFGGPPPPPPAGGELVLGVSTTQGQVLGATTMAKTGPFTESLYLAIMGIGGTLTAFGLKNFKKTSKKA